jgi:rhamnose transport system permease protein
MSTSTGPRVPTDEPAGHEEKALVEPSTLTPTRRILGTVLRSREIAIAAVLVAVILAATVKIPSFLFSATGWRDLLLTPSMLVLLAVGQAAVIITRNVDLSVGSVLGLTAYLTGTSSSTSPGSRPSSSSWPGSLREPCSARSTACW